LERAYDALMRHGIRVLVIDPWNEIEHAREKYESDTAYINRALRLLIKFGRRHGLATYVLAHPTKEVGKDGKARVRRSTTSRARPPGSTSLTSAW